MTCIAPHCAKHGCLTGCDDPLYPVAVDTGLGCFWPIAAILAIIDAAVERPYWLLAAITLGMAAAVAVWS